MLALFFVKHAKNTVVMLIPWVVTEQFSTVLISGVSR